MNDQPAMPLDWILETDRSIQARLAAAKRAQAWTRLTLIALAIATSMMLVTAYNAYLSYDFEWARSMIGQKLTFTPTRTTDEILTDEGLRLWAGARNVQIPLLGIRVSVDDVAVPGLGALLVLAVWLMLCARRENQTIGSLLRDTEASPPAGVSPERRRFARERRWWIFHAIVSNSVHSCVSRSFQPIDRLTGPNPADEAVLKPPARRFCDRMLRFIEWFFYMFPVLVSLFVFLLDRWSFVYPDPFMPGGRPQGLNSAFFWLTSAAFVVLWLLLTLLCIVARRFSRATETIIQEYLAITRRDLEEGRRELTL